MYLGDGSKEAVTDLRLSLDYSNQGTRLTENTGAGANAASRVNMTYVASDHLTELVWSPHKGLSIKCASCCASAARSTHMPFMVTCNTGTKPSQMNEASALMPITSSKLPRKRSRTVFASQSANRPDIEGPKCKTRADSSPCPKVVTEHNAFPIKSRFGDAKSERSSRTINKDEMTCLSEQKQTMRVDVCPTSDDVHINRSFPNKDRKGLALGKLELNVEDNLMATERNNSDPTYFEEAEVKSHRGEFSRAGDNSFQDGNSPAESRIHEYHRKGKAKVLTDGNVESIMQREHGSHCSVESCNSAGSFAPRQKKRGVGQEFINGNKRLKETIQSAPQSTTLVNGNSSFMSWISNMVKGFNRANVEEAPCLTLTLATAGPQNENHQWKLISHRNNKNHGHQSSGFQNLFQSLYGRSSKGLERTAMTDEFHKNKLPFGVCIGANMVDVAPLSIHEMASSSCKGDQSTSGNGERELLLPGVVSNREHVSLNKKMSCNPLTDVQISKFGTLSSSPSKRRIENDNLIPPENKATSGNVMDPLQSFWITRFCPKIAGPKSVADQETQGKKIDNQTSLQPKKLMIEHPNDLAGESCDASVGLKGDIQINEQTPECKIDQKCSAERLESSEAMASIFARRLDALKHMTPTDVTGNSASAIITCFYCGKKGHDLRNCYEVTGNEFQVLVRNNSSPNRAEESPCFCIRCFQLGHWATQCPSDQRKSVCGPPITAKSERLETFRNRIQKEVLMEDKDVPVTAYAFANYGLKNAATGTDSRGHEFKEPSVAPLSSIDGQNTDILKGCFGAVRKLRLSRRDIVKLIDSQIPLCNLEGYFLRLRLGNWEKGLGGTGYHVACIDGVQSEGSSQDSKLTLSVSIGSIKCLVGSRSISSQDFFEDELMAWWSATVKNGCKLPTQEELNNKVEERSKLFL